jgi:hypothetical protein
MVEVNSLRGFQRGVIHCLVVFHAAVTNEFLVFQRLLQDFGLLYWLPLLTAAL